MDIIWILTHANEGLKLCPHETFPVWFACIFLLFWVPFSLSSWLLLVTFSRHQTWYVKEEGKRVILLSFYFLQAGTPLIGCRSTTEQVCCQWQRWREPWPIQVYSRCVLLTVSLPPQCTLAKERWEFDNAWAIS